jgi:hypothetical protein
MKDWKSTAAGVLSFLITTLTVISALLAGNNLSAGGGVGSIPVSTWVVISVNGLLALCRAWIGLITTNSDAGAVAAAINKVAPAATVTTSTPAVTAESLAATPKVTP